MGEKIAALRDKDAARGSLVKSSPGVGKSEHTLNLVLEVADDGYIVLVGCSSRERRDEMAARARKKGISVVIIEGRGPQNCPKYDNVDRATKLGYDPAQSVCVRCPLFPTNNPENGPCGYYVQHDRAVAATRRRGKGKADVVFGTSDAIVAHVRHGQMAADWIVFDEEFHRPLVREVTFDAADLVRPVETPALQAGAALLAGVLVKISSEKQETDHVVTRELARYVMDEAGRHEQSATQVLMDAIAGAPDFSKGGLYNIDDETWERVPDRRLVQLFEEVLREVAMLGDDSERAYRVRATCESSGPPTNTLRWVFGFVSFEPFEFTKRIVALDAYGSSSLVSKYLGVDENDPKEWGVISVRARVAPGVTVRHLTTFNGTKKRMGDDLRLRVAIDRVILPELERMSPRAKDIALYTWKRNEEVVAEGLRAGGFPPMFVKHFFQDRGDDRMRACDTILIVGEPRPNPNAMLHRANAIEGGLRVVEGDARLAPFVNAATTQELAQILHRTRPVIPRADNALNRIMYWGRFPLPDEFAGVAVDSRSPALARADQRRRVIERICRQTGFWSSDLFLVVHLYGRRLDDLLSVTGQLLLCGENIGCQQALYYIESIFTTDNETTADAVQSPGSRGVGETPTKGYIHAVPLGPYGKAIMDAMRANKAWRRAVQEACEGTFFWTKQTVFLEGPGMRGAMDVYGDVGRASALAAKRGEFAALVRMLGGMKRTWLGTASDNS